MGFYRSTVGKKVIMAVTGLIGIGFVILHVAGNLQAFEGREKLNAYSAMLHGPAAELLWLVRAVLIVAVILHVLMAAQLTARARAARPVGYRKRESQVATFASRTMRVGGFLLLAFIVFHILHFTTRQVDPAGWAHRSDVTGRYDIYGNVVGSFRIWWVSAIYLIAMVLLGLHMWHGVWSFGRSLGVAKPGGNPMKRRVAPALAVLLWLGFSAVPVAVLLGVIR
ncbi:MAG TPA: succinate dehydrogenase cytochrome b subunit [Gemmatimonadaceae bacterium]|nr:succinate dehydrogenase cytochrome b subunit [Gemmatimonadaceae bacterium]